MAYNKWETVDINTSQGNIRGVAPVIISASRSTDIPAFYAEWFISRLNEGYVKWVNPFNRSAQYVSFNRTRAIVFWTKDANPLIPYLKKIDEREINYYFTFSLNDYDNEGLEPNVRKLEDRISTFKRLSDNIGKDKVIWRFDPLIMTDRIDVDVLLDKIHRVGNQISDYTNKLVISFADISSYRRVQNNLRKMNINYKEFTSEMMHEVALGLSQMNKSWGLDITTCSEGIDLSKYLIKKNKCIDDELMVKVFSHDKELMNFLGYEYHTTLLDLANDKEYITGTKEKSGSIKSLKDKGQREHCGCIVSKDIGQYDTCDHQCVYCYANSSPLIANSNYTNYLKSSKNSESIIKV